MLLTRRSPITRGGEASRRRHRHRLRPLGDIGVPNAGQGPVRPSHQLRNAGIIFAYCGYVTEPVLAGVGDALKQKLADRRHGHQDRAQRLRRFRRADAEHHPLFGGEREQRDPPGAKAPGLPNSATAS